MSISQRKHRARIFDYVDAGTEGVIDPAYALNSSGDADDAWFCAKTPIFARESTTGMKAEHHVDMTFEFGAEAPANVDSAIDCDGESFVVRKVVSRDYGINCLIVEAERKVGLTLTAS